MTPEEVAAKIVSNLFDVEYLTIVENLDDADLDTSDENIKAVQDEIARLHALVTGPQASALHCLTCEEPYDPSRTDDEHDAWVDRRNERARLRAISLVADWREAIRLVGTEGAAHYRIPQASIAVVNEFYQRGATSWGDELIRVHKPDQSYYSDGRFNWERYLYHVDLSLGLYRMVPREMLTTLPPEDD